MFWLTALKQNETKCVFLVLQLKNFFQNKVFFQRKIQEAILGDAGSRLAQIDRRRYRQVRREHQRRSNAGDLFEAGMRRCLDGPTRPGDPAPQDNHPCVDRKVAHLFCLVFLVFFYHIFIKLILTTGCTRRWIQWPNRTSWPRWCSASWPWRGLWSRAPGPTIRRAPLTWFLS